MGAGYPTIVDVVVVVGGWPSTVVGVDVVVRGASWQTFVVGGDVGTSVVVVVVVGNVVVGNGVVVDTGYQ